MAQASSRKSLRIRALWQAHIDAQMISGLSQAGYCRIRIKHRRVLSFNYLGMRLSKAAQLGLTEEEMQAARQQIMLWAAESDWGVIKLEKS